MKSLEKIEVISFDLDDTLWPLYDTLMSAEEAQYDWIKENVAPVADALDKQQLLEKRRLWMQANPHLAGDVTEMRKQSLAAVFTEFEYEPATVTRMVEQVFDVFYRERSRVTLFEDARLSLTRLKQHFKVAAITNGNADLEIAGVSQLFDAAWLASLESPSKPDPFMFDACARYFDVSPERILHVGDNVTTDVGGGQGAGTLTAWYNPAGLEWPADLAPPTLAVSSLTELADRVLAAQK